MKETARRLTSSDGRERCHAIDYVLVAMVFPLKGTPVTKNNEASAKHLVPQIGFHRCPNDGHTRWRIRLFCAKALSGKRVKVDSKHHRCHTQSRDTDNTPSIKNTPHRPLLLSIV
ncbi:hypothetical protein LUS60_15075 [Raoultella planticola]|nr:hypothetical protein [Raoultella planticola]MCD9606606.1 hypothetical protein [Raoultella planticola]